MSKELLDRVFSQYIRLRDSDDNGMVKCISCGKVDHWKKMHNGHFINRKHMSLRFSEINCNAQCPSCNLWDEGNFEGYRRGLIQKHGEPVIDKLYALKNTSHKMSATDYKTAIKYYREKIKEFER